MSRDIDDLDTDFIPLVTDVLSKCESMGYSMRPFFTVRTPKEQARLWRQSRSRHEIKAMITKLRINDAVYLANVIEDVGPQNGRHVTNAIPGMSWHQWGQAVDCFWLVNNTAEWSTRKKISGNNGYHIYAEIAKGLGLTAGGFWNSFKDWPHIQGPPSSSPTKKGLTLIEVSEEMSQRFGNL